LEVILLESRSKLSHLGRCAANQAASSWWEEAIYFYVKPPISDLFVKNPQFDQKGYKMIAHINQYFN
jgi:hypothetical protein